MPPSRHETSPTPYANTDTSAVRRNLFSAHLSRRPASGHLASQSNSEHAPSHAQAPQPTRRQPNVPRSPYLQDMNTFYDPQLSPSRHDYIQPGNPFSPTHDLSPTHLYPSSSIVALNPVTGRPLLPNIPTLPAQLRLSSSDSSSPPPPSHHLSHADEHRQGTTPPSALSSEVEDHTHHQNTHNDPASSHWFPSGPDGTLDTTRIEKSLVEMYYRQRQKRAAGSRPVRGGRNHHPPPPPRRRGRRYEDGSPMAVVGEDDDEQDGEEHDAMDIRGGNNESGDEELMGLLMASLRKKVGRLEEERWMFEGSASSGRRETAATWSGGMDAGFS